MLMDVWQRENYERNMMKTKNAHTVINHIIR